MGPEVGSGVFARFCRKQGEALELRPGKMLFRPRGAALRGFMCGRTFAGRLLIMIGDDSGDLPVFEAAEAMAPLLRVAREFLRSGVATFLRNRCSEAMVAANCRAGFRRRNNFPA